MGRDVGGRAVVHEKSGVQGPEREVAPQARAGLRGRGTSAGSCDRVEVHGVLHQVPLVVAEVDDDRVVDPDPKEGPGDRAVVRPVVEGRARLDLRRDLLGPEEQVDRRANAPVQGPGEVRRVLRDVVDGRRLRRPRGRQGAPAARPAPDDDASFHARGPVPLDRAVVGERPLLVCDERHGRRLALSHDVVRPDVEAVDVYVVHVRLPVLEDDRHPVPPVHDEVRVLDALDRPAHPVEVRVPGEEPERDVLAWRPSGTAGRVQAQSEVVSRRRPSDDPHQEGDRDREGEGPSRRGQGALHRTRVLVRLPLDA